MKQHRSTRVDKKRRHIRFIGTFIFCSLLILIVCIAFLPWIVAKAPFRDVVINQSIAHPDLYAISGDGSFTWSAPWSLDDLQIVHTKQKLLVDVPRIQADRSLINLCRSYPNLGSFVIDRPHLMLVLAKSNEKPAFAAEQPNPNAVTWQAILNDARVDIRVGQTAEPVIDLADLDFVVYTTENATDRRLVIEPVQIFDHYNVTRKLCDQGLQLVAPILAKSVNVEGQLSFDLDEFSVPLVWKSESARTNDLRIRGNVVLHEVSAGIKTPILKDLASLAAQLLGVRVPSQLRVAEECGVTFRVRDGRVHHEGLAFFLPELSEEIVFRTSGSVGFDESLNLVLDAPFPQVMVGEEQLGLKPSGRTIALHITGTIDQPELNIPNELGVLAQLAGDALFSGSEQIESPFGEIFRGITDRLLDMTRQEESSLPAHRFFQQRHFHRENPSESMPNRRGRHSPRRQGERG